MIARLLTTVLVAAGGFTTRVQRCVLSGLGIIGVVGALGVPASASAAPIKECGRGYSTAPYPNPVHNITTRNLRCRDARRMVNSAGFICYCDGYVFRSRLTTAHRYRCRTRIPDARSYH